MKYLRGYKLVKWPVGGITEEELRKMFSLSMPGNNSSPQGGRKPRFDKKEIIKVFSFTKKR